MAVFLGDFWGIFMIVETLATGDEVVQGDVVDSNSAYLSRKLAHEGALISRHTTLPDEREALKKGILEIASRADFCVASGGLGPTEDDLTVEVVSSLLGVSVVEDQSALERLKLRYDRMGLRLAPNNVKTVTVPVGAEVFQNEVGTAPAFSVKLGKCEFFFLPGVPKEFYFFVETRVLPRFKEITRSQNFPVSFVRQLKTLGIPESHVAEKFLDYPQAYPQVKVGYRVHGSEVWLKLTAQGESREAALGLLEPAFEEARSRLGDVIFGKDDEELPTIIHQLFAGSGKKFAVAESCTGGILSSWVTAQSGSSEYFEGGAVVYSESLKKRILGVPSDLIYQFGVVSGECAEAMALGALERFEVDYALAITGIAGPSGGTEAHPVGTVYLALADRAENEVWVLQRKFRGDRERVQRASALTALEMLRRRILGVEPLKDGVA